MVDFKIIKKAYKVNFDKIEDGFLASGQWCYAENRNEAKKKLLDKAKKTGGTILI